MLPSTHRTGSNRAIRIDFLGPPGVGKTTLIKSALASVRNAGRSAARNCFTDMDQALAIAARNCSRLAPRGRIGTGCFRSANGHGRSFWYRVIRLLSRRLANECVSLQKMEDVRDFVRKHASVVHVLVSEWFDPALRFEPLAARYYDFFEWIRPWIIATKYATDKIILADNSRFTKGIAWLLNSDKLVEAAGGICAVQACFQSIAGPSAVVCLNADPREIVSRVRYRQEHGFVHPAHRDQDDEGIMAYTATWLSVNARATAVFRRWGVPTLVLDANAPIHTNVHSLLTFAENVRVGLDSGKA